MIQTGNSIRQRWSDQESFNIARRKLEKKLEEGGTIILSTDTAGELNDRGEAVYEQMRAAEAVIGTLINLTPTLKLARYILTLQMGENAASERAREYMRDKFDLEDEIARLESEG